MVTIQVAGKVALVTGAGAARGTGRAIALRLAAEGAAVVVDDLDERGGDQTVRMIEAEGGRAAFVRADMTLPDEVREMVAFATRAFGGLDILVNNAGATPRPHFPSPEAAPAHWGRTLDLNLRGPMLAIQLALPDMRARGGGAIVNVSSVAGVGYRPHDSPEYAAAKAGLIRLTATLAPLAEAAGVRVNCVVPQWIETDEVRAEIAALPPEERAAVPPQLLQPEEIADAVLQLVVDDTLAGRVMVCWCGQPRRLIPLDHQ